MPIRLLIAILVAGLAVPSARTDEPKRVSLHLTRVTAEVGENVTFVRCDVTLDNATGRRLEVKSSYHSAFDGLEVVLTSGAGRKTVQQMVIAHQSPFSQTPRVFPLEKGKVSTTLVFPIMGLPKDAYGVRLVGTLPGSGYDRLLASATLPLDIGMRVEKR